MGESELTHSAFRPDPYPYTMLVYRELADGRIESRGILATPVLNVQLQQLNQRATRMQTGDRSIHDMSLRNLQLWDRLSDGGVGAKESNDSTRYRWAKNVFAGDKGEIKLAPLTYVLDAIGAAEEEIVAFFNWPGPKVSHRAAGTSDAMLTVVTGNSTNNTTNIYQLNPTAEGATITGIATINDCRAISACVFKNVLYLGQTPTALTDPATAIRMFKWNGTDWESETIPGNHTGELLFSDSRHLYRTLGNEVFRSADPSAPVAVGPPATPEWEGPAIAGDGAPITGITVYGNDEGIGVYVTTWNGFYRGLEEEGKLKRFSAVDQRFGTADDEHGKGLAVVNNEIVWPYPRGILRHTLGQTSGASPWEDDGVPYGERGIFNAFQDGVGGIYVSCNPLDATTGRPTVYRWSEGRWHTFLSYADASCEKIKRLYWTNRQLADTARLWIIMRYAGRDRIAWLPMPTSAHNYRLLPQTQYPPSGYLDLPNFTGEFAKLLKEWNGISLTLIDEAPAGSGNVTVEYTTQPDVSTPSRVNLGSYTCVPNTSSTSGSVTWVPCQPGVAAPDMLRINEQSSQIQVRLTLQRSTGAAYPDTKLESVDGALLADGAILMWGVANAGDERPHEDTRPICDAAIMEWTPKGWKRVPLMAASVVKVLQANNRTYACGQFYHNGTWYGIAEWDRVANTFNYQYSGFVTVAAGVDNGRFWFLGHAGGNYKLLLQPISPGSWEEPLQFNGPITKGFSCGSGQGIVAVGTFTSITGWNSATITKHCAYIDIGTVAVRNVEFTNVSAASVLDMKDVQRWGLEVDNIYFAMGTYAEGRLWKVGEAALNGSTTCNPVTLSVPTQAKVTAIRPGPFHFAVGLADGAVWHKNGAAQWVPAMTTNITAEVKRFIGYHWVIGNWDQMVYARDANATNSLPIAPFHAAQLVYLPHGAGPLATPTPVVERIGVWFFEHPPTLLQYTVAMEIADNQMLMNGQKSTFTSDEQLAWIKELCDLNETVTIVLPDRRAIRGWLGGYRASIMADERDKVKAPINWKYLVNFTVTQLEPSTDEPTAYYLPGIRNG